jgi:AAA domain
MIVGLCGAHRTGKTTLATEFCKKDRLFKFAPTSVSQMMISRGFDPALDYGIEERIAIQEVILTELDQHYSQHEKNTIFDRTPLDAAAYMLADVRRENVDPATQGKIVAYVERAIDITNRRFAMLLYVPPVLKLEPAPGKAPAEPAYVEHIAQIINGLKNDERMRVKHYTLPRRYTDIDTRVAAMQNATGRLLSNYLGEVEQMNDAGIAFH